MNKLAQRLFSAACKGDVAGVRAAIKAGADVLEYGVEAVKHAADHGHATIVALLVRAGADVNELDGFALYCAAGSGQLAAVQCLLAAGADVHADNDAALRHAARSGHRDVVKCLLAAGADPSATDAEGYDALAEAAREGHLGVVETILLSGPNALVENNTALYWAAEAGNTERVTLLRENGADLLMAELVDIGEFSPAVQAALLATGDVSHLDAVELTHQGLDPEVLVLLLERQGQADLAALLKATKMLEPLTPAERAEGIAPLVKPAQPANPKALQAGMHNRLTMVSRNDNGALHAAVNGGHWPVVVLLLRAGASIPADLGGDKQVAACAAGALTEFSAVSLARQGFCPEAVCELLKQQGRVDLAATLTATQMLEPLDPEARADLLENMLAQYQQPESPHVNPQ